MYHVTSYVCVFVCVCARLCHRQEVCKSDAIMCPLCDKRCKVWRLSDTCTYAKVFSQECIKHIVIRRSNTTGRLLNCLCL